MGEGHYLAGLDLRGRKVVVVGGGSVAQRRLPNLIAAGADVHVIAVDPRPTVEAEPAITVHRRAWAEGDLAEAWYAMACTDDPAVKSGAKFKEAGIQVASGVPLQCGEREDFSTFRLGLFGLDKLQDVDGTVERLRAGLDKLGL